MSGKLKYKVCTKCGKNRRLEYYYYDKANGRYYAECKKCKHAYERMRRKKSSTPESRVKAAARKKAYFRKYPGKNKLAVKRWHAQNLELHKVRVMMCYYRRQIRLLYTNEDAIRHLTLKIKKCNDAIKNDRTWRRDGNKAKAIERQEKTIKVLRKLIKEYKV